MTSRMEAALTVAIDRARDGAPPTLAAAFSHAVFPGGARVRPRLSVAVAAACGDDAPALATAGGVALELLHCASLVHDDLPCFDDAATRRGLPSVHNLFGEAIAVLVGDGLIVQSFEVIAHQGALHPARAVAMIQALAKAGGSPGGIVAGQAWESEPAPPLSRYHHAKTGSLFRAATTMGALSAGADPTPWAAVGDRLGEAYQVADDLLDAVGGEAAAGKPTGRDAALNRPSAVIAYGLEATLSRFENLVQEAMAAVPACAGRESLRQLMIQIATRLVPLQVRHDLRQNAA